MRIIDSNIDRDRRNKIAFIEDIGRTLPEGYDAETVSYTQLFPTLR